MSLTAQPRSIIIRWTRPAELGGRSDLFYEVLQSDPDQSGVFMDIPTNPDGGSTSFTLTGLRPYTQYCVRVIAHNGVSDQDPDGTHLRTVEECVRTDEDRMFNTTIILFHSLSYRSAVDSTCQQCPDNTVTSVKIIKNATAR